MNTIGRLVGGAGVLAGLLFVAGLNQLRAEPESEAGALRPAGDWPPVIGAWFWTDQNMEAEGYKSLLDATAAHSPYTLLSTAARISKGEIVEPQVYEQMRKAVSYALTLDLGIALEVDLRVARAAFRARYPDELQEELVLKTVALPTNGPAVVTFNGNDLSDHMIGSAPPYLCLTTRVVRAYSFVRGSDGIDPATVQEIGANGIHAVADGPKKLTVTITSLAGRSVCVIAAHSYFTPDVFAPHLFSFQREIIRQYAGLPLAGVMKDEWGFPPDHTGNPAHDRYWYSPALAQAYAKRSGGRELVRDSLLMFAGERAQERERQAAINRYRGLCRERNAAVEDDFYRAGKETFGPDSLVVTHATWTPYPGVQEFRKSGLDWWDATRDIGQCDESTPYPCRTSLAKRWGFPLWYNQFYAAILKPYARELWADALSGGRLNVHQLYPRNGTFEEGYLALLRQPFMHGMTRLRMLDFIARAPLDCPVAVIFGHVGAMNWAAPGYDDVGLNIAAELCGSGYPADLFPTTLVGTPALRIDADGYVCLGVQRYRAVVLYHPEFEGKATLEFFQQATKGKTAVFVVGDWTRDFDAQPFEALPQLSGAKLHRSSENATCAAAVRQSLEAAGIERVTAWSVQQRGTRFDALPPMEGHSRLTDGTYIRIAGSNNAAGDPINETFVSQGHTVAVDATGLVAIRFSPNGKVAALAAGGLKSIRTAGLEIALPERIDFAFRTETNGQMRGVIQGWAGPVPEALRAITSDWQRLAVPPLLPATNANIRTIVAFGDSITRGSGVQPQETWVTALDTALTAKFGTAGVRVINSGVGGNTSAQGMARLNKDVLDHHPQLVLVEFGGNDTMDYKVSLDKFEANIIQMVTTIRAQGGQAVLVTFPPVNDAWHGSGKSPLYASEGGFDKAIERYREKTRALAIQLNTGLMDMDHVVREAIARDGWEAYMLKDGIHLTPLGHRIVAKAMLEFLSQKPDLL